MTREKKLIAFHIVLLIVCEICRIYCQINMDDWYYRFQMGRLYIPTLIVAKPLFYYALAFLATYFLARKAFRDDLHLPYKVLGIIAAVLFAVYVFMACISFYVALSGTTYRVIIVLYSYGMHAILDYYSLLCIPGVLFGLVAENHWNPSKII